MRKASHIASQFGVSGFGFRVLQKRALGCFFWRPIASQPSSVCYPKQHELCWPAAVCDREGSETHLVGQGEVGGEDPRHLHAGQWTELNSTSY